MQKVYNKIISLVSHPHAQRWLALFSFTESCCFIIPPEVLLLPMGVAQRKKIWRYALITVGASLLGAMAGRLMGVFLWESAHQTFFEIIPGLEKHAEHVGKLYGENAVEALLMAAITPIPFKVFTIMSGVYADQVSLPLFLLCCAFGRGVRYFALAALIFTLGEKAKVWIQKYFGWLSLFLALILIGLFIVLKKI